VVLHVQKALHGAEERPRTLVHRALLAGGGLQQVGPPGVADENEVAAQEAHRRLAVALAIGDEKRHVLGRVAGRVKRAQLHAPDGERVAVFQKARVVALAPAVGPVSAGPLRPLWCTVGAEVDGRAGFLGQLARAAEEVGVDVRLGHGGDFQSLARGGVEVAVDVALGIDHQGLPRVGAADEVGVLGELVVDDLAKEHGLRGKRRAGGGRGAHVLFTNRRDRARDPDGR
jgi:hypothetical protein